MEKRETEEKETEKKEKASNTIQFNQMIHAYLVNNPAFREDKKINEVEVRFGINNKKSKPLSKINFENVIQQLYSAGFVCPNTNGFHSLRINTEFQDTTTGIVKLSNIRTEIVGMDLIQEYCRTNSLQLLLDMPSMTYDKIKFTKKTRAEDTAGKMIQPIDFWDFNFRVSYQLEQNFTARSPFIRNTIVNKWNDSKKVFRYLNRIQFKHKDMAYPIIADLSIVKSSTKTKKYKSATSFPIPKFTIQEANVFDNPETYEIELEIDNRKVGKGTKYDTYDKIIAELRKVIRVVLSGLQGSHYPVSFKEMDDVLFSYMNMIYPEQMKTLEKKENLRVQSKNFIGPSSNTLQMENISILSENSNIPNIRMNYTVTDKADGERRMLFISNDGKIYMIDMMMQVIFTGAKTTNKNLFNTLLDGEHIKYDKNRKYINLFAAFDVYFVRGKSVREFAFYPTDKQINEDENTSGNTGDENVTKNTMNEETIFTEGDPKKDEETGKDVILIRDMNDGKGENDTKDGKTGKGENQKMKYRLTILNVVVSNLRPISVLINENKVADKEENKSCNIRIQCKTFYANTNSQSIFQACSNILSNIDDKLFEYNTDGLIFTPCNTGVGSNIVGKSSPLYKTTWDLSFKWKPAEFNTIDFLVSIKKDKTGKDELHNVFQDGKNLQGVRNVIQYKVLELRCGFDQKKHGFLQPFQDIIDGKLPNVTDIDNEETYKPVLFQPTHPFDETACYSNVFLKDCGNNILSLTTEEGEYFEEDMIVEFRYDMTKEDCWKWVPIRVRYDKTNELRSNMKNYGNAYHVANANWKSIHNPITKDMITTSIGIPEVDVSEDVYYNRYGKDNNTEALRNFHNLYVKRKLITSVSNRGDTLIDYAVGKGGDMSKWIDSKLFFVFGIDIHKDNIHNPLDGACSRYLSARRQYAKMPFALFVNGNSSLNIRDGTALISEKDKQIGKAVFGTGIKDATVLGKGVFERYGIGKEGFSVSSCQFALHYFFENKTTLHEFVRNLAECTKLNGYFIGTCYDGETVFKLLKNKSVGDGITIMREDKKIYELTKIYRQTGFPNDENSIGFPINVYQETINKTFQEFLVNFVFFTRIMEDYGFIVLPKNEANHFGLPNGTGLFQELFTSMEQEIQKYPSSVSNYGSASKMSYDEKRISFMNRYFVFKKMRNVNTKSIFEQSVKPRENNDELYIEHEPATEDGEVVVDKSVVMEKGKSIKIQPKKLKRAKIVLKSDVPIIMPKITIPPLEEKEKPQALEPIVENVTLLQKEEFRGVVEEEKNTKDVINPPKKSSETIKIKRKIQK